MFVSVQCVSLHSSEVGRILESMCVYEGQFVRRRGFSLVFFSSCVYDSEFCAGIPPIPRQKVPRAEVMEGGGSSILFVCLQSGNGRGG